MKYLSFDLGHLGAGCDVEFTLSGHAANVRLVDPMNLSRYRRRERFQYVGCYATASPVVLRTPSSGHWHAIIDTGGASGQVRASVRVLGGVR